jgi:O-antigen ligase
MSIIVTPWSINIQNSVTHLIRSGYYIFAALLSSTFLTTYWNEDTPTVVAKTISIVSLLVAITVITDYFSISSFGTLPGRVWSDPNRAAGIVGEPNFAAGLLAISLPFFIYFSIDGFQTIYNKLFYSISAFITTTAIYFTGSRMGILLIMFCVVGIIIIHRKILNLKHIISILLCIPAGLYILTIFQTTTIQRFARLIGYLQGGSGDGSIRGRMNLVINGLNMIKNNPVTGVGPGNFINAIVQYPGYNSIRYSHNTYIDVASQTGIIGCCLFILLLLFVSKRLLCIESIQSSSRISSYYIVSYLLLLVYLLFLSDFFNVYFWFVFIPISISVENSIGIKQNKQYSS